MSGLRSIIGTRSAFESLYCLSLHFDLFLFDTLLLREYFSSANEKLGVSAIAYEPPSLLVMNSKLLFNSN